ncbi:MAG TPA: heavy metal translocating P-type ATPase [Polyangiaceae bacterium]|nr:heavy metal translocating P-type ATPase [Polyangiaceae bacterium]
MTISAFPTTPELVASADVACSHCGLPVPSARVESAARFQFCCDGCRSVHTILNTTGLESYYALRGAQGTAPARVSQRRYAEFDDAAFIERHVRSPAPNVSQSELFLEGIHCSACVWLVERLPRVVPGVVEARLDLGRSELSVVWERDRVKFSEIARGLASLGYPPHASAASQAEAERRATDRTLLLRIGIAGAAAGNVMLMALALYSGLFSHMDAEYAELFRWGSFAIATPTVAWTGNVFFRGAWASLRTKTPHMDLPITIGILAGYVGGAVNTLRGSGEVYFDSLCTLIFLLLVGRWLQRKHHRRAANASDLLTALAPSVAEIEFEGERREVPAESVTTGSIVVVRAGERIPVDGVVTLGSSSVDSALLTGETAPVSVSIGDRVYAGTINQASEIRLRCESSGEETRVGRLMQSVEQAQRERAPIVRLADRVAGYFVWVILTLAAVTLVIWAHVDPAHAVDHTVALLVVTCPCALGMATPLAVSAALSRAARQGLLFKGGEFVEELARPKLVVFDKTGTLTEGRLELVARSGDERAFELARAAEAQSNHPIARAFQRALPELPGSIAEGMTETAGGGLVAEVSGHAVCVGSLGFVEPRVTSVPEWAREFTDAQAALGRTPVLVAIDGELRAAAAFGDRLRADAATALTRLRKLGVQVALLSGDHQRVVDAVVGELGGAWLLASGGTSPEQKLARVREYCRAQRGVVMVGDGVNDAAALSSANVGIALHGGAEASLAAADVFTTEPGLMRVVEAVEGSRRTLRVIQRGVAISLAYNLVGVGLAVAGVLSPLWAAVLMPLSSVSVVTLALRSRTFAPERASS